MDPLADLRNWIEQEKLCGNRFANGAVLGTVSPEGVPHTRMLGAHFCAGGALCFFTSPPSRKVQEISANAAASLTFAFQHKMRSATIDGLLAPMDTSELDKEWAALSVDFKRTYHVFGHRTGEAIQSLKELDDTLALLPAKAESQRPESFIGYRFVQIDRIAYYEVTDAHFATSRIFTPDTGGVGWHEALVAP